MAEAKGIQETLEIIDATQSIAVDAIKAAKNGIDFSDISVVTNNLGKIKTAVERGDEAPAEMKDLDLAEVKVLVNKAIDMVDAIMKAVKEPKAAPVA